MLTFYFSPGSSSMAAHIALHEVGAPFEGRSLSFANKDHQSPDFLAINPEGKVPTLLIEGRVLTEVAGILYYLARRYPEARLLPHNDIEAEAQVVSWMSFIASTLHPARRQGLDHVRRVYAIADRRLRDRDCAVGSYSIADIHLFRLFWRVSNAFGLPREEFPSLFGHHDRMMERTAVRRVFEIESAIGYDLPA